MEMYDIKRGMIDGAQSSKLRIAIKVDWKEKMCCKIEDWTHHRDVTYSRTWRLVLRASQKPEEKRRERSGRSGNGKDSKTSE